MNEVHGILTSEQVHNATFASTHFKRGYDETEVDDFMDEVVRTLKHYENGGRPDSAPLTSTVVSSNLNPMTQQLPVPNNGVGQTASATNRDEHVVEGERVSHQSDASDGVRATLPVKDVPMTEFSDSTADPTPPATEGVAMSAPGDAASAQSDSPNQGSESAQPATAATAAPAATLPSPIHERGGHVVVAMADGRRTEEFGAVVENKSGGYQQVGKRLWRR